MSSIDKISRLFAKFYVCQRMHIVSEVLGLYGQVIKRTRWMPWRQQAMKDVVGCEKPRRAVKQALTRGCPNGGTHRFTVSASEYIGCRGEPRELKHLST